MGHVPANPMHPSRREVLSAGIVVLAGCTSGEPSRRHDGTESSPTPSGPKSYLPKSAEGWELKRTNDHDWEPLGGDRGIRGYYTGPQGRSYEVVIMFSERYVEGSAESWSCAGWQISLALDGVAVAASTGTNRETFTPEKPPTMTKSPDPDREDRVRELLALSPRLSETDIEERRIECSQ